jgi:hypothetical protein
MKIVLICIFVAATGLLRAEEEGDLATEVQALRKDVDTLKKEKTENSVFLHPGFRSLKISGEVRIREEYKRHLYSPTDPNGDDRFDFAHMRTRLRFDLDVTEDLSAVVELQDVRTLGESTTNDAEGMDLKRGEMLIRDAFIDDLTLEAGRFVMFYGDQRLIGHLEWVDQGRTYDGFRLSYKPAANNYFVDVFGFRLADLTNSDEDDQDCFGIYAGNEDCLPCLGFETYVLVYRDQRHMGAAPLNTTEERFTTYGIRASGERNHLDYSGELAYQDGYVGVDDLEAWAFAAKGGYTVEQCTWTPRLGAEVDYASGDRRGTDKKNQTFQTLFPTNHIHYGYMDLMGWSNMWDFNVSCILKPREEVKLSVFWHHLLLDESFGGWINAGGATIRPGVANASRHLGEEFDLAVQWSVNKSLSILTGWSHFMPGGFVDDTGRDRSADFGYLQARLVF